VAHSESEIQLPGTVKHMQVPWPPMAALTQSKESWKVPNACTVLPLPLQHMAEDESLQNTIAAKAAQLKTPLDSNRRSQRRAAQLWDCKVGTTNIAMIYMSPDPYFEVFEQPLDINCCNLRKHATAGLDLYEAGVGYTLP
jgi:hypothetical protein